MRRFLKLHKQPEIFIYFTGARCLQEASFNVSILISITNQAVIRLPFLKTIRHSTADDQELLNLYRTSGDTGVLAELYQRYMDLLYSVCLKYLKQPEPAKDAVMAVFEELVSKLKKHEPSHFKGWV